MTLNEKIANYLFNNHADALSDGMTVKKLGETLEGLNKDLSGLSNTEITSIFESTPPLKSFVDKRLTDGISAREKTLLSEHETNNRKFEETIKSLKAKIPLSADPAELRKLAESETDDTKKTLLMLKADNIENKQIIADANAREEAKDKELQKQKLINIAKSAIGDKKIPKSIKLESYIGEDEESTKQSIEAFISDLNDYDKDIKTGTVNTTPPPAPGVEEKDGEANMNEKLDSMSFLDN